MFYLSITPFKIPPVLFFPVPLEYLLYLIPRQLLEWNNCEASSDEKV